jgi:YHS domain-containing protein
MPHIHSLRSSLAGSLVLALLVGCGDPTAPGPSAAKSAPVAAPKASCCAGDTTDKPETKADHPHDADDDTAGLAELSSADRAAAEKQAVCPVTGEKLGSMGKPCKVTVKGQTVFLCCAGCEGSLNKDPDKYLAKLKGKTP